VQQPVDLVRDAVDDPDAVRADDGRPLAIASSTVLLKPSL
jgi:hypothetical protein